MVISLRFSVGEAYVGCPGDRDAKSGFHVVRAGNCLRQTKAATFEGPCPLASSLSCSLAPYRLAV